MLTTLAWILGIAIAWLAGPVLLAFILFATTPLITALKLKFSTKHKSLLDSIRIEEISKNVLPLPDTKPNAGNLPIGVEMLLHKDGTIENTMRYFDNDPGETIQVLLSASNLPSLAFNANEVYLFDNYKLGERIGEYTAPALKQVQHVSYIDDKFVLVVGTPADTAYVDSHLWQVNRHTLEKTEIASNIFFTFERPPKTFTPYGFDGVVVVYYIGSLTFDLGGHSSRPEFSVIRIFNKKFPDGKDIARFSFKAGIIVAVCFENNSLILTGDPSRPLVNRPRLPARIWRVHML